MEGFPVGFRFHPTDNELVSYYLRNKAMMGDAFQSPHVVDCPEFYGKLEPWTVWDKYGGNTLEEGEPLFFFTKRRKLNPRGSRFDRKVGTGTWSGQYLVKVLEEGKVIGKKRDFRYEGGSSENQNNAWLMDEYELNKKDLTVLCTLRRNPTKPQHKTQGNETEESTVDENKRKREFDDVVGDLEQDMDQRRKLIRDLRQQLGGKKPRKEKTCGVKQGGGCSSCVDHHQASTSRMPNCEVYRPQLVPNFGVGGNYVFSSYDLLPNNPSNGFLDQFYEDDRLDLDWLAKKSSK